MAATSTTERRARGATAPLVCLLAIVLTALTLGQSPAYASRLDPPVRSTPSQPPDRSAALPLGDVLRGDGTLDTAKAAGAALDAEGYTMATAPDGTPRFVADDTWAREFGNPALGGDSTAVAVDGDDVYVGGTFFYGMAGMSNNTFNRIAKWDGIGWQRMGEGVNDTVRAITVVGDDVYVGGEFTVAGDVGADLLARWDGRAWSAVAGGVSDPTSPYGTSVGALASDGRRLFVGGHFTRAGSVPARSLAVLDLGAQTWAQLGGGTYWCASCNSDETGTVHAFALRGTTLYVGGSFDRVGSRDTRSFASVSTTTGAWTTYGSGIADGEFNGIVRALAIDPATGTVYVGGNFDTAGGVTAWNLAKLSGSTLSSIGNISRYGGDNATVSGLAFAGGKLYIGGDFTTAGNISASYFAAYDGIRWSAPAPLDNVVNTLATQGTGVVVLGDFAYSGDFRVQRGAVWTGTAWRVFGHGVGSDSFANGQVSSVLPVGAGAYVGGLFDQAGSRKVGSIARWTGTDWDTMAGGVRQSITFGQVFAMTQLGDDLYVAGRFDFAGNITAKNIAKWDGTRWSAVGGGTDRDIFSLAVLEGKLYAGGRFTRAGDVAAVGVARFDPATNKWSQLGNAPEFDNEVRALAVLQNRYLVIGGAYNGMLYNRRYVTWDLYGMALFDTKAAIDPNNPVSGYHYVKGVSRYGGSGWVRTMHVVGDDLYVGGWFDTAGIMKADGSGTPGFTAVNLAVWHFDTNTWEPVGDPDQQVYAITSVNGTVLAGGWFTNVGGVAANRVARYDPVRRSWSALGTGVSPGSGGFASVEALGYGAGSGLWTGGQFPSAGDSPSGNIALWRGAFPAPRMATLTVARAGRGAGTVTSTPGGIRCGDDCTHDYAVGTSVTLTATPAAGSVFTGWGGGCTGAGRCTVSVQDARQVTATFGLAPPAPTTLASAASAPSVVVGASARINGTLTRRSNGSPVTGRAVALQVRTSATGAWAAAGSAATSTTGAVAFTVKPTAWRSYRLVFSGTASEAASTSAARTITVAPRVTMAVSAASVKKGAKVTFSGAVSPAHAGQPVALQRLVGTRWTTVRTVALSSSSAFRHTLAMTSTVDYSWRVYRPADADHLAAASPAKKIVVR